MTLESLIVVLTLLIITGLLFYILARGQNLDVSLLRCFLFVAITVSTIGVGLVNSFWLAVPLFLLGSPADTWEEARPLTDAFISSIEPLDASISWLVPDAPRGRFTAPLGLSSPIRTTESPYVKPHTHGSAQGSTLQSDAAKMG